MFIMMITIIKVVILSTTCQSHESFNFNNYVTKVYYCSFQAKINEVLNGKVHVVIKL